MNLNIYKMEMIRNLKSFIIWAGAVCGMIFFGMLFYPAINADGLLTQMEVLFENPMMKGLLAAFGADVSSLGSLMGFYVTYNSIYNVLLGCIFASVLAGNLLAKEEAEKTAEFLFTRPVSRSTVFISKTAVMFTYITLLGLLYFLTSAVALEVVKKDSPKTVELSTRDRILISRQIKKHPDVIYEAFNLTEDSFDEYALTYASTLLAGGAAEMAEMNLDPGDMNSLIDEAMNDSQSFFTNVLESPEKYMKMFSVPPEGREEFLENVRNEEIEYRKMKESFFSSPEVFLMIFNKNPEIALNQFVVSEGAMARALELLDLPTSMEERIFRKYSIGELAVLCTYIYLLILAIGSIVLFVSLFVRRGRSVLGLALGLVFFFYFLNSLSTLATGFSPILRILGYVSPFTWMDTDFSVQGFCLSWWRVLYFAVLSALSLFTAMRMLLKKDILL